MKRVVIFAALMLTGCMPMGGNGDDMSCAGKSAGGCNENGDWEWSDESCGSSLGMFGLIGVGITRKRRPR